MSMQATESSKILVRGVNWLGDAVMTEPAMRALRSGRPDARITLLTMSKLRPIWERHPTFDEILTFEAGESVWSVAKRLKAGQYDLALALPNSLRSALEAWLARIPQRIGYAHASRSWLLTQAVPPRPERVVMRKRSEAEVRALLKSPSPEADKAISSTSHQLYEYLHLVGTLGAPTAPSAPAFTVTEDETAEARQAIRAALPGLPTGSGSVILVGANPGAEYGPAKRWPIENFAATMRQVSRRSPEVVWLLFGAANDVAICAKVAKLAGVANVDFSGKTSLRQLMALLRQCNVLLTNDTGPMHLAAALGTPVVVPFGSTSPELTGPGLPGDPRHQFMRADAPCSPCFRKQCPIDFRCMTRIPVDKVAEAVLRRLQVAVER